MSLFTKSMDEIEYHDVRAFFDRKLREGLRIEYKANFPSDLGKIVIAFANTAGGIILIGIKADTKTNMPEEIVGIPLRDGLEEQVTDITMSNIRPPISPEVKVCPFKSQDTLQEADKAVVVIRVSESELAPHSNSRDGMVWVRNHNRCDSAGLETIEQLLMKRDESAEIRERMLEEIPGLAYKGARAVCPDQVPKRYYQIVISPLYPVKTIPFDKSTDDFLREQVGSVGRVDTSLPRIGGIDFERRIDFQSGSPKRDADRFFSVTRNAMVFNVERLELSDSGVYVERVVQILAKMLRACKRIYERFEYFGKVFIQVTIWGVEGLKFEPFPNSIRRIQGMQGNYYCQDPNIALEEVRSFDEIGNEEKTVLYSFYNNLLRSFKISIDERTIKERLDWLLQNLPD